LSSPSAISLDNQDDDVRIEFERSVKETQAQPKSRDGGRVSSSQKEGGRMSDAEPFTLQERLYTPQEVAERLGVSERWVRDHATRRSPRIRVVKLGPLLRFREADIAAFVAAQMTHPCRGNRGNL
jgi:excisionase family DNA binding protein